MVQYLDTFVLSKCIFGISNAKGQMFYARTSRLHYRCDYVSNIPVCISDVMISSFLQYQLR